MGSDSDLPKLELLFRTFEEFDVTYSAHVLSAHRTPDKVAEFASTAAENGYKIIIAAAGGAAHLAGVVAAHTLLPVIGIPVEGGAFHGMDALLATVQMPGGVPVVSVAVGKSGGRNAALYAVRTLALNDEILSKKLVEFKKSQEAKVIDADGKLDSKLREMGINR